MARSSTSFKHGHRFSVGNHNSGRKRLYDYKELAKDLDQWSLRDDALSLYSWTDDKPFLAQDLRDFAAREPIFALALKKAKERIGLRRERAISLEKPTLNYGAWSRSARLYDVLMKEEENEEWKFKASLAADESNKVSEDVVKGFTAVMTQLKKDQESSSDTFKES